jgi:hypothetical protein
MSESPDETNATEIKKTYSEAITKATRFLISSGIILFLLIVIVGQELRDYRKKQAEFAKQIATTVEDRQKQVRQLNSTYKKICKILIPLEEGNRRPRDTADIKLSSVISVNTTGLIEVPAHPGAQFRIDNEESQSHVDATFKDLVDGCRQNLDLTKGPVESEPFPRRTSGVRSETDLRDLSRDQEKLDGIIEVLKKDLETSAATTAKAEKSKPQNGRQIDKKALLENLATYHDRYRRIIDLSRDLLTVTKETKSLNAAKNSIPTPFGNFEIAPRLALLGLTYAILLVYLSFQGSVRKIRALADSQATIIGEESTIAAPLWSPSPRQSGPDPTSGEAKLLSILVHFVWLAITAWLTFECLFRWNATKALAFDYKSFWGYLLLVVFIATFLVAVWLFLPGRFKKLLAVRNKSPETPPHLISNRRVFIGLGAITTVGLLTFGVRRLFARSTPKLTKRAVAEFTSNPSLGGWIQNKRKKKVVHFSDVCQGHLPIHHNPWSSFEGEKLVHAACHARIYEQLGMKAAKSMQAERQPAPDQQNNPRARGALTPQAIEHGKLAIAYFEKAIALEPFALHLYDRIRKVYGALEDYAAIPKLLAETLKKVQDEAKVAKAAGNRKRHKKLLRLEEAFTSRVKTTANRRKGAAEWKASQENPQTNNAQTSGNAQQ